MNTIWTIKSLSLNFKKKKTFNPSSYKNKIKLFKPFKFKILLLHNHRVKGVATVRCSTRNKKSLKKKNTPRFKTVNYNSKALYAFQKFIYLYFQLESISETEPADKYPITRVQRWEKRVGWRERRLKKKERE